MYIPSIYEIDPYKKKCGMWLEKSSRYCRNSAGRIEEILYTQQVHNEVLAYHVNDDRLEAALLELAERTHCRNCHRKEPQIKRTAQHWLREIESRHLSSRVTGSSVRSTSVPASWFSVHVSGAPTTSQLSVPAQIARRPSTSAMPQPDQEPPSRSRPLTRAQVASRATSAHTAIPQPTFSSRTAHRNTRQVVAETLLKPLTSTDKEEGHVYIYSRPDAPHHIKIGYSNNVDQRLRAVRSQCKYIPTLLFKSERIPHARRVEQLVFAALQNERRNDHRCRNLADGCPNLHTEWFEVKADDVICLIRELGTWIKTLPYDENCGLWSGYGDLINHYRSAGSVSAETWVVQTQHAEAQRVIDLVNDMQDLADDQEEQVNASGADDLAGIEAEASRDCAICLDSIEGPSDIADGCPHCRKDEWHHGCINTWLREEATCPMCRGRWKLEEEIDGFGSGVSVLSAVPVWAQVDGNSA